MRDNGALHSSTQRVNVMAAWLLAVCVTPLLLASGCTHAAKGGTGMPSELRVGMAAIYPPVVFKQDGRLVGIEPDMAYQLGKDLNVKVQVVELPWDDLIPALLDDKIDVIMSGMTITEDRSNRVNFTVPYLNVGQMALIRESDYSRFRETASMNQPTSRVGVLKHTTSEAYARAQLPQAQIIPIESLEVGLAALRSGKIDFYVQDAPTIWLVTGTDRDQNQDLVGRYQPLTDEYLAWGVRPDDDALLQRLNAVILRWHSTGQIDAIVDRWIKVRKIALDATP